MESIYYVMSWLCHRTCEHCYERRFHPYHGDDLRAVVDEAKANFPRVIANFPKRLAYRDPVDGRERTGRVILAGGEILLDPVREPVLYPAIDLLHAKYRPQGGIKIIVQTTGDVLTERIMDELLARNVWMISVSGVDDHHAGLETEEARERLRRKVRAMFESRGMTPFSTITANGHDIPDGGHHYNIWGANPGMWIEELWPRGRAFDNELNAGDLNTTFCTRKSGGANFLHIGEAGAEVSVEPTGNVYPCCIKTRLPVGSLLEEPLEAIFARLRGNPVYEAINAGRPERMGLGHGWSEETFRARSSVRLPSGRTYENLCVGCDRFHEEVLMGGGRLVTIGGA